MSPFDIEEIKKGVLKLLYQSDRKVTPQSLIKKIRSRFCVSSREARKVIQQLIDEQELSYHYLYGSTYIEKCFLRPVRMTEHFIIKPPGYHYGLDKNEIEISIEQGLSFGSGQHPTTQLCLEAIEFCFFKKGMIFNRQTAKGLDVGTGSGVLAIAMCLSGLGECNAYEIDPVSVHEAKRNVYLNHLKQRVSVIGTHMEGCREKVSIVAANLRYPTLKTLSGLISSSLIKKGVAIFSGVREWEKEALIDIYVQEGFDLAWQRDEKKWSGFVLIKKI